MSGAEALLNLTAVALRFSILGSSSSGNCALLVSDDCKVLIDAGFSRRRTAALLEAAGETIDTIDAIFLTHEHSDHCSGLTGLCRQPNLRVFANRGTAEAVQRSLRHRANWHLFETGARFRFRDLEIESFTVPHDATEPVGFVFSQGAGDLFSPRRSVAWVIDLGYAPELVRQRIRDVDILVLEANHDRALLQQDTRRPWSVKQRISGRHGHLSNEAACDLVSSVDGPTWQHVCLAHLSRDCNSLEAVTTAFAGVMQPGPAYALSVVTPEAVGPAFELA